MHELPTQHPFLHTTISHSISHALFLFFFNDTPTTEIYTLSLHDALPISEQSQHLDDLVAEVHAAVARHQLLVLRDGCRSEEHTSELQSRGHLVCRLLLEKKKKNKKYKDNDDNNNNDYNSTAYHLT